MTQRMLCADCKSVAQFTKADGEDWTCPRCGFLQRSTAAGARELCLHATWHNAESYRTHRLLALVEFDDVPATPPRFAP